MSTRKGLSQNRANSISADSSYRSAGLPLRIAREERLPPSLPLEQPKILRRKPLSFPFPGTAS